MGQGGKIVYPAASTCVVATPKHVDVEGVWWREKQTKNSAKFSKVSQLFVSQSVVR